MLPEFTLGWRNLRVSIGTHDARRGYALHPAVIEAQIIYCRVHIIPETHPPTEFAGCG